MKNVLVHPRFLSLLAVSFLTLTLGCMSCSKEGELPEKEPIDPAIAMAVNDYLRGLSTDWSTLLNVQGDGSLVPQETRTGSRTYNRPSGNNRYRCTEVSSNLTRNFDEVAILRPTNGIVYPGALVKINEALLKGVPEPITLNRAPSDLRLDLPGIGEQGNIIVESPTNGNTQTKIDEALDWWNNNRYEEGYVNAANSSYEATTSYSSEQSALNLGMSASWASGSLSGQFSEQTSSEKSVAMAVFKQAFYTVNMETPSNPADVFGKGVTLADVQAQAGNGVSPGYVQSVTYGRLIMFRMEASAQYSATDVEAALKYGSGKLNASGSVATKYQNILQSSSITLVTIGGNAEAAAEGVSARDFGDLEEIIKGKNALYSRENPGVPIAYTVKSLGDNSLVKMGFTTDYTTEKCSLQKPGAIRIRHEAFYDGRYTVKYTLDGKKTTKSSGNKGQFSTWELSIPAGAVGISLKVEHLSGFSWQPLFSKNFDKLESKKCYKIWGTVFSPQHRAVGCG
ncbi:MAG: thiol-activated cytolysin family protein [Bacteroidota bacterium]